MRKKIIFLSLLLVLFFLPIASSQAVEENSENLVIIKADEIKNSSLFTFADNVIIDGKINGDLIVISSNITVNGQIDGDIIALAEKIEVNGQIGGNIRAFGSEINLNGPVSRNITIVGEKVSLGENGRIFWDAYILSPHFENNGSIDGELNYSDLEKRGGENKNFWPPVWPLIYKFFCALVVGLVLIFAGKKILSDLFKTLEKAPRKTLLPGLLFLLLPPFCFFFLSLTLISIPLVLISIALWLSLIYLAKIFIALFIGKLIIEKVFKKETTNLLWSLVLGLFIIYLLLAFPYLGGFISFIIVILGLGTLYLYVKNKS